ncbi:hypothetical protein BD289DRAFT_378294, partial [Coniella lustricola]
MANNGTSTGSQDVDLDASWQTNLIACAAATWGIAAVFVALRFYLRGHMLHVLGREDWMILVSLFFSAAYSTGYIVDAHYGFGKHAAALSPATLSIVTEVSFCVATYWLGMLWFTTTVLFTKVSILFLYLRTLTHAWVQRTLRVLLAMVCLTSLTDYALMFTTCIPLQAYWDASIKAAYCHSMQAYYAILGIQLGTDFFTFLLPLPVIWSMRAPKDQKIMLLVLICVVSIIRLTELASTRFQSDFTYDSAATDFWSLIEANTGIVCACIMTMNPLLRRLIPDTLLTRRGACESTQDPLGINGGGGKTGKSGGKGGGSRGGSKIMRVRDKSGHGGHGGTIFFNNYSINPPTIGSKPSR